MFHKHTADDIRGRIYFRSSGGNDTEETEEIPEVFTDENQAAAGDEIGGGYLNLARRKFQSLMMRVTTQQLLLTVVIQLLPVQ